MTDRQTAGYGEFADAALRDVAVPMPGHKWIVGPRVFADLEKAAARGSETAREWLKHCVKHERIPTAGKPR